MMGKLAEAVTQGTDDDNNYYKGIEISVILKNKPGSFNSIYAVFQGIEGINADDIKAFVLLSEGNFGILRIVVETKEKATLIYNALLRRHFVVSYTIVLKLYECGSYERIKKISDCFKPIFDKSDPDKVLYKGINIEYIYTSANGLLIMKVGNPQEAIFKLKNDLKELFPEIPIEKSGQGV